MSPNRIRTGTSQWLEQVIDGFRFEGEGWYNDGKILVLPFHGMFQAYIFDQDPRPRMEMALKLPVRGGH